MRTDGGTVTEAPDRGAAEAALRDGTASVAIVLPADFVTRLAAGNEPSLTVITPGLEPTADSQQVISLQRAIATAVAQALPDAGVHLPRLDPQTLYGTPEFGRGRPPRPGLPRLLRLLLRLHPDRHQLPAGADRRHARAAAGDAGLARRDRARLQPRLRPVRDHPGPGAAGLDAARRPGAGDRSDGGLLGRARRARWPAARSWPSWSSCCWRSGRSSLGILLSTFARTELQVVQFIPLVIVPQALLSGVLFPVSSMPDILQAIARVLPLTYATDGLRQVVIRGADLG